MLLVIVVFRKRMGVRSRYHSIRAWAMRGRHMRDHSVKYERDASRKARTGMDGNRIPPCLGNTLNKKTIVGPTRDAEKALGREIIAQGFAEAIGLRLDKVRQRIYVTDLSGRLCECMTEPGPKTKIYERAGHSYTGLAIVKY